MTSPKRASAALDPAAVDQDMVEVPTMTSPKRALAAVDQDKVEVPPIKKQKVEEEDGVDIEGQESKESEEEYEEWGLNSLKDIPEPNPEWDVDSFEGLKWESDDEVRARLEEEEEGSYEKWRASRIKAYKDKGFLPDHWNRIFSVDDMDEPWSTKPNMTNRKYLTNIASLCVQKLNEMEGTTVEFVSLVRGNMRDGGSTWKLYITFMAKESPDGPLLEYQAKAMDFAGKRRPLFPILCRRAPKLDDE